MRVMPLLSSLVIAGCTAIEFADGGAPSSGAASSSGGSGGAGGAPSEICGNGIDDEPDGATDCEDADCEKVCGVPAGWTGPVAMAEGGCEGETPGVRAIVSASGSSDCECACKGDPTCESVHLELFAGAGCTGGGDDVELESQCVGLLDGTDSLRLTVTASCGAPEASLLQPDPEVDDFWLCAAPAGTCIHRTGGFDCPSAFPNASLVATNLVDARSCDPDGCVCEPDCGTVMVSNNQTCTAPIDIVQPGPCENLSGNGLAVRRQPDPEVCSPSGTPSGIGVITLTDAITICCE